MAARFQAVPLVAPPTHPNAIAWSNENLVAVASGHLVTILNPAMPFGPKGLITIPTTKPFSIGVIDKKDLVSGCMLPTCLSRDVRPCVRSISWSPLGLAPNAGCLLAVCTTEGVVKIYGFPFREFTAEWVQVMDISEMLHTYFVKIRYGEADVPSSKNFQQASQLDKDNDTLSGIRSGIKSKYRREDVQDNLLSISAEEYASRSAMLSSVVVAWSPMIDSNSLKRCSILAVGAKSGGISLWKVNEPQSYSITQRTESPVASLIGLIHTHKSWITAISWSIFVSDGSHQLILSTGSSDGSVKLWRGYTADLLKSTQDSHASFLLVKEVINIGSGPISALSLVVPDSSPYKIILAIGKGCGSVQIWTCDIFIDQFDVIGPYYAHDHIITGLAWAYDGRCLYSCSQDNSMRSWIIKGDSLNEVPLPSNILGVKISTDVPNVSDACFGISVSPASLVVAVVRSFDVNLLHPMYQARSLKAAVEFFWIGGQKLQTFSENDDGNLCGFPNIDLVNWERNILWSLNQYQHDLNKPLVIWDIISALSAFKKSEADYLEKVIIKWLITSLGFEWGPSLGIVSPHVYECLSNLTSRQLHLLNVINRHVILKENIKNGEEPEVWIKLLEMCEIEVRERLIGCSFSAAILKRCNLQPVGLAQMRLWVEKNDHVVKDYIKLLASKMKKIQKSRYVAEEECSYCSSPVPFSDPEVAYCQADNQKHKLARCAVSMNLCPVSPLWFCVSCNRWVSNLAPDTLFTLPGYPPRTDPDVVGTYSCKPQCPFCGILLQRLQPEFLLSTTPV